MKNGGSFHSYVTNYQRVTGVQHMATYGNNLLLHESPSMASSVAPGRRGEAPATSENSLLGEYMVNLYTVNIWLMVICMVNDGELENYLCQKIHWLVVQFAHLEKSWSASMGFG